MAESPVHSLASLRSSAISFGSDSRPASSARSDASFITARPGSSTSIRTISHEIDHIKTLVSRATESPRTPSGSISAQVFRPRSSSFTVITQAHVFHELDNLKRRIIQEQPHQQQYPPLTRRTSQIDPGQESDSDHEDVYDEREVELERAREDATMVRQRLDGLLDTAERKIDQLTAEKQRLEVACEQRKEGLVLAALERRNLTQALDEAHTRIDQLAEELEQARNLQNEQQSQFSNLHDKRLKSDAAFVSLQQQLVSLQSHNTELETNLHAAQAETKQTLERLEVVKEDRVASEAISKDAVTRLQERLDLGVAKSEEQEAEIRELRSTLVDVEAATSLAESKNVDERARLQDHVEEGKKLLQDALDEVKASQVAQKEVAQTRDKLASEIEEYHVKLEASLYQQEQVEKQLSDAHLEHEEQNRILRKSHETIVAKLQSSVESITARLGEREQSHSSAVEDLARQHTDALDELRISHQSEVEQVRLEATRHAEDLTQKHASAIDELQAQHGHALEELRTSFDNEKERTCQKVIQESDEAHARSVQNIRTQHERDIEDLKTSHQAERAQLHLEASDKTRDSAESHAKALNELHSEYQEMLNTAKSDAERISDQLKNEIRQKDELLAGQRQDHERSIQKSEDCRQQRESKYAEEEKRRIDEHRAELSEARSDAERRLQELADAHAHELQRLTSEHQTSASAALQAESDRHRLLIEAIQEEASDRRSELSIAYEKIADLEAQLSKMHLDHQQALASLRVEHDISASEFSSRYAQEVETKRSEMQGQIDDLQAAHEAKLAEMQDKHNQAIESLKADHAESTRVADERHNALRASHVVELADRESHYEHLSMQLGVDHQEKTKSLENALRDAVDRHQSVESSLAAVLAKHNEKIAQLQEQHRIELVNEHDRAQKTIAEATGTHQSALESVTAENQSAMSRLQADLSRAQRESEELKNRLAEERVRSESDHQQIVAKLETEWSQRAEDANRAYETGLQEAVDEAARKLDAATQNFHEQLREQESAEASRMTAFQVAHAQEATCIREDAKTEVESRQAELEATKQRLLAEHSAELARLRSEFDTRLGETQLNYKTEIEELSAKLDAAETSMRTAVEEHRRLTTDLQSTHVSEIQHLTSKHSQDTKDLEARSHAEMALLRKDSVEVLSRVTAIEAGYEAQIKDLKFSHDAEVTILKNEVAAYVEDIKARSEEASVMSREIESLEARLEEARFEAEERALATDRQYKAALGVAVERTRQNGQAELRNLKKRHQDAVAQVRATAQRQAAAQLTDLEKLHQAEFTKFQQSTSEAHQGDVMMLETEHQTRLAELESRLQEEREIEVSAKEAAYHSQMTALQARVDASLTGQAEAERTVALLRQQAAKIDRRSLESKASAEDQVATLQRENEDLLNQLNLLQSSLRDMQKLGGSGASTPSSEQGHGELASLKLQLTNFEEERLAMHRTMERRSAENLELARQNDFLVKELDVLLAQRARARKMTTPMVDAVVQTDAFISEPKVDLSSVQLLKAESRISIAPLSPGQRRAKDEIEMAWTTRSFEDFLDNARTELSHLGSVISANESLFAQKISEHVSELQKAKDQLAADYDARISSLADDKGKMELMVLSKQQAAFARDREELVASYTDGVADAQKPSDLSDRHSAALRAAEERLVADYNKRIFRRKSQIALKHAEEFQNVTRDYDRKVADLIDNKSRLEGDLSIDPTQFEQDMGELQTRSARLAERSGPHSSQSYPRASPSPVQGLQPPFLRRNSPTSPAEGDRSRQLTRTSTPRTSLSIPRSASSIPRAPLTGELETALPLRRGSERHPPVPQLSLMRAKTPSDVYSTATRVVSSPLTSASPVFAPSSPSLRRSTQQITPQTPPLSSSHLEGDTAHDLGIEPSDFEQRQFQRQSSYFKSEARPGTSESSSKPSFLRRVKDKMSHESSAITSRRPGSSSSTSPPTVSRPEYRTRSRSTKLSSGMIYYQAPRYSPPPKTYEH